MMCMVSSGNRIVAVLIVIIKLNICHMFLIVNTLCDWIISWKAAFSTYCPITNCVNNLKHM